MTRMFTIGFTKKNAKKFFEILESNGVKRVLDVRLNNKSQLAGFAKGDDLKYFLEKLGRIDYEWWINCAPSNKLLKDYRVGKVNWKQYTIQYLSDLDERDILANIDLSKLDGACLLCSEHTADMCHRRLLAEYIQSHMDGVTIKHL